MDRKAKTLLRKNNHLEKQLNQEDELMLNQAVAYLKSKDISSYQQETIRSSLIKTVIAGKDFGEGIKEIVNDDLQGYLDEQINHVPQPTLKKRLLNYLSLVLNIIVVLGIIKLGYEIYQMIVDNASLTMVISLGDLVVAIVSAVFSVELVEFICSNTVNNQLKYKIKRIIKSLIMFCFPVALLIIFCIFYGSVRLISLNIIVYIFILIVLFVFSKVVEYLEV